MKKYYFKLTKDEQRKIKDEFKKEYKNKELDIRLKRLLAYSIIGYLISILIILEVSFTNAEKTGNLIIAITLFIASTIFIVGRIKIKLDVLNKIALKKK